MKLSEAHLNRTYRIFLSSGDDALDLRNRVESLVINAINPQLLQANTRMRLEVDRWEATPAQRTHGANTNDQFVERAQQAHLTLPLLLETLGNGTREEIEAVLETDEEISALWFVAKHESPETPVAEFLTGLGSRLYYDKTGPPDSADSWEGIVRVLMRVVLEGLRTIEAPYVEQR